MICWQHFKRLKLYSAPRVWYINTNLRSRYNPYAAWHLGTKPTDPPENTRTQVKQFFLLEIRKKRRKTKTNCCIKAPFSQLTPALTQGSTASGVNHARDEGTVGFDIPRTVRSTPILKRTPKIVFIRGHYIPLVTVIAMQTMERWLGAQNNLS